MTTLWYIDTENIVDEEYDYLSKMLPFKTVNEIDRFRFFSDRKLKLFARLLVQKFFKTKAQFSWDNCLKNQAGKPSFPNVEEFNISHSGEKSIVVFSDLDIGADIEKITDPCPKDVVHFFHENEINALKEANYDSKLFYKILPNS